MPKYVIKRPRYHNGEYVHATPESPAVIELAEGVHPGLDATPHKGGEVVGDKLVPAFNPSKPLHPSAAQVQSEPKKKGARPSDGDPI